MGVWNSTTLGDQNFDFANATAEDVHFAYVLRMPFRFRVASPHHCHFEFRSELYDIWIKNEPLPEIGESALFSLTQGGRTLDDFWSRVVIIPNKNGITAVETEELRRSTISERHNFFMTKFDLHPAMQAINAFTIAYHNATGEMSGGHPLHLLMESDYYNSMNWQVALVGIPLAYWSGDNINTLFDLQVQQDSRVGTFLQGEILDLPPEKLSGIPQAFERLNDFYFYELAFEAKAKMASGDFIGGLLLAVAALEGAHGAFVTSALESKLPAGRTGEDKNLEDTFLKELGFSLCNKLTPYLFMEAADRPSDEMIKKVANAVKYRNEIMHALRNNAGQYKSRLRTNAELNDAFSAALTLYDVYRGAVEKLSSRQKR